MSSNDVTLVLMTLVVPMLILVCLHLAWRYEWKGDKQYTLIVRVAGWLYATPVLAIWYVMAR